jgi:phosphoribosylformylglycinamidine synthase
MSTQPQGLIEPQQFPKLAAEHGLSGAEAAKVLEILGRHPSITELGIFSVMWSEHCSYKSSRLHLGRLPTTGARVIQGPGENAGVVDIGEGDALAFKMESHNHPSYIEPYQGAATGVGGILRDVFTMGARPIANLNLLRFGEPSHPKTRSLVAGVVKGIGDYGNCMGIPTVGGEVFFNASYNGNCLVNAMTVGLIRADKIFKGVATGVGNPILYFGSKTGRDGIHGATMASAEFVEGEDAKRPTVQVGDPFTEKLLLEACLELMEKDCLVGIQDMGAAGLTSSSFEMAGRSGNGIELELDKVPMRETGMTPYELMLSESQERMLAVVKKGREHVAMEVFDKWDLDCAVIGVVTGDGRAVLKMHGAVYADMPIDPISTNAPKYDRPSAEPESFKKHQSFDLSSVKQPGDLNDVLKKLLGCPNLAEKRWVWRQYDHHVRTNTVAGPGAEAAVVRIKGRKKAVAITTDCNSRFIYLDPRGGTKIALAEAARNISMTGATPIAITDCLNFGSPEKPEIMWQFKESLAGMTEACNALDTPVVSGNVSFYNETDGQAVYPTPAIGMVGMIAEADKAIGNKFTAAGQPVVLLGATRGEIGGSEYLSTIHGLETGAIPPIDLAAEKRLQTLVRELIDKEWLTAAKDCSDGGLAVALAEMCIQRESVMGAELNWECAGRTDFLLFGEDTARAVIAIKPEHFKEATSAAEAAGVHVARLGYTGGERLVVKLNGTPAIDAPVLELKEIFESGFVKALRF